MAGKVIAHGQQDHDCQPEDSSHHATRQIYSGFPQSGVSQTSWVVKAILLGKTFWLSRALPGRIAHSEEGLGLVF